MASQKKTASGTGQPTPGLTPKKVLNSIRSFFRAIRRAYRNPIVRISTLVVLFALYLERENVWEFLKERTPIEDWLETVNPYTISWLKEFDDVLFQSCGHVIEPWCLPNIDAVVQMLDDSPLRPEGSKYQTAFFRVFGMFLSWPRSWPTLIILLDPANKWTAPFCNTTLKTDYLKKMILLDALRFPRYSLGELKKLHPDVAALWTEWFEDLRSLNSTRLTSLLDDAQQEGDEMFLGGQQIVSLVQFLHTQTIHHILTHACPDSAKALIESDRGKATLLHAMAKEGNTDMVELLVDIRPEADRLAYVTKIDPDGYTAEHLARLSHFNDTALVLQKLSGSSEPSVVPTPPEWPDASESDDKGHSYAEDNGWYTDGPSLVPKEWLPADGEPACFAETVDAALFNWTQFVKHYTIHPRPLLIRGGAKMIAQRAYTHAGLIDIAGKVKFDAEEFPYAEHQVFKKPIVTSIKKFAQNLKKRREDNIEKDRLHYIFIDMDRRNKSMSNLSFTFLPPRILERKLHPFNTQFFLGGDLMGSPYHHHEDAFNSLVFGRKLWFMKPPSQRSWSNEAIYRHLLRTGGSPGSLRCIQESGDLLFVPRMWSHGAICLSDCVGVAHEFALRDHEVPVEYQALGIHHDPYNKRVVRMRERRD